MNKKGQIGGILGDIFIGVIVLIMFIFGLVIGYTVWVNFNSHIQDLPDDIADASVKAEINSWTGNFLFLDKLVPFMFLFLWGAAIASSVLTNPDHPFFFLISLGVLLVLTFISIIITDFSTAFFDNAAIIQYSQDLSYSSNFLHSLHLISFFVMLISSVYFYSKGSFGLGRGVQ